MSVADGVFDMPIWLPATVPAPAILLIQEIFGVGPYIRKVAEDLAGLGYVVGAPDLFWRQQPHWEAGHDDAGLAASFDMVSRFDVPTGLADCRVAVAELRSLPEVAGGSVGALGFCLGGSLAYFLATDADLGLDTTLSFYGSAVPGAIELLDQVSCPLLFVFGGSDPFIPRDQVSRVAEAAAARDNVTLHVAEQAGHAFHNHEAPQFYDAEAAPVAWELGVDFLRRHLPTTDH